MWRGLLTLIALGLIMRVGYAVAIFDETFSNFVWIDYTLYRLGAEKFLQGDAFTDSLFLVRPPLFPLLVAALDMQPFLIIAANILLGIAVIPLTYLLARQFTLSQKLALLAAGIVAIDPTSIKYSAVLIAEPLANLLLAAAFVGLVALKQAGTGRSIVLWGLLAGFCIVLSALTRPSAYLLWIPTSLWIAFVRRRRVLAVLALVFPAALGVGLWKYHNAVTYGNSSFTTISTFNLLYYRAASVLHQATGQKIETVYETLASRVEDRLGNDISNITVHTRYHHFHLPSPRLQSIMTEVAFDVFREYPLYYVLTIPVGLYRLLLWLKGVPVWLGTGWNIVLLLAAIYGLWRMLRLRKIAQGMFLLIPVVYFVAGTLLVITADIDTRARVMVTPLLAVMAAHGVLCWLEQRR